MSEITQIGPLGDEAKVGKLRDKDKLAKEQEKADITAVMETASGRRFISWLLRQCELGSVAFYETDRISNFILGHQNVGHKVVAELRRNCLDMVRLMEDEERSWQTTQQ